MGMRGAERHWASIPPALVKRLRPRVGRVGDALLTLSETSDSLRLNRVVGFGCEGRARAGMVDEIVAFYRASKRRRFSLQLGPGPQAATISRWLLARGFRRHGGLSLLVRAGAKPVSPVPAGVRVVRAGAGQARVILAIHERVFAIAPSRRDWTLAALAADDSEHYLAYVGRTPVWSGTLRIDGKLAWLCGGATLTRWRRCGVHGGLIAARLRRAALRGCRWIWVETAEPVRGRPAGSRRNLIRMGFEPAAIKPIFVWSGR